MNRDAWNDAPRSDDPPTPMTPAEEREALLTAYALDGLRPGELDAATRGQAERLLTEESAADGREQVDHVRRIAAALTADRDADLPERSADLRRAVLAAVAAGPTAAVQVSPTLEAPRPRTSRTRLFGTLAGLAALAAAVAFMVMLPQREADRLPREVAQATPRMTGGGSRDAAERAVLTDEVLQAQAPAASMPSGESVAGEGKVAAPTPTSGRLEKSELESAKRERVDQPADLRSDAVAGASRREQAPQAMQSAGGRAAMPEPEARRLGARAPTADKKAAAPAPRQLAENLNRSREFDAAARPGAMRDEAGRGTGVAASDAERRAAVDRETYDQIVENPFRTPAEAPLSTFSIDVDTASYANVRRFLAGGRLPPRDAVRIEELVNYFRYDLPQPAGDAPFSVTVDAAGCPWGEGRRLVRVALQGRSIDRGARPAGNIVFLIDVSGSMRDADKLPLVKQALAMLVEELGEDDRVSIVTYAGEAGLALPPTGGEQKERIRAAIERLAPGGSTHGSAGIELAYEQAAAGFVAGGVNRVILATDGDLNVGVTGDEALIELIKRKAAGGTFLTVLGVGTGNLQDAKMEKLADNGNGVYAYLDGIREARKVLVEQLTGSTIAIAKDVKIQVEFNPARVASYRLIGYENRALAAADFHNDRKDAGEIGAGHAVTALYEIVPAGGPGVAGDGPEPLKYRPRPEPVAAVPADASPELLTVKLRYKRPDGDTSTLEEVPFTDAGAAFDRAPADFRFAAAVASFGMLLRGGRHAGSATLSEVAAIAGGALGPDAGGYRAEFLDLVRKAQELGGRPRD
jgi:Ca-activated chloride channel family protein